MAGAAWPKTSTRNPEDAPTDGTVSREDPRLAGPRWMLLWAKDPLGECCCPRGTVRHGDGTAGPGSCTSIGKHPWMTKIDGELAGFVHGAADALEIGELVAAWGEPGGARQLAATLADLVVVDLDSDRAVTDFARLARTIPREKIIGVSSTPRGYHVWLDVPGWNQKALNAWMAQWLTPQGGWDATDAASAGRRGFLLDVRTGERRYVVWPGARERSWVSREQFNAVLMSRLVGMPAWRMADPAGAPWAVDTADPVLAEQIAGYASSGEIATEGYDFDGSATDLERSWSELERWIARLESMPPGSGRNNALNTASYYAGATAVAAGHDYSVVSARLIAAGEAIGTHGVRDTVNSGLRSGTHTLKAQIAASGSAS